ncbi:MAG: multidrug effflux MFS transporter [Nitratireductor sp.]|nr:multidrug effflux MFS transporter [Nitratireductor sp.]
MSERRVSLLGGLFVAIGPISMSLYTPAMPEVVSSFGTTETLVKFTLTSYFGGFACAQLVAGPVSDAVGRRPVMFCFLGIYIVASILCFFSSTIEMLVLSRFLQGVGASAGVAISRAIVRDLYTGEQSSRIMNLIGIILAIGPALSPTLGGLILLQLGWRAIFLFMLGAAILTLLLMVLGMKETVTSPVAGISPGGQIRTYGRLLTNRHFTTTSLIIGGAVGAIYTQATFLPFILMDAVGLTPTQFGIAMLFQSGAFFLGSLVMRYLMKRISAYRLVFPGMMLILAGSAAMPLQLFMAPGLLTVMLPVSVYVFGIAFVMPAISTAALAPFAREAGAASALLGFVQMGSGLLGGSVGALFGNPTLAMATIVPTMGVISYVAYRAYLSNPHIAEPEPRSDVISAPPVGRSLFRD